MVKKGDCTMKSFEIKLVTRENKKNGTVESSFKAELRITDELNFSEIVEFVDNIKGIWKKAMAAVRKGSFMEMEVIESTYDNWMTDKPLVQKSFDWWVSVPAENQDEEGIYLKADERYTPVHRDMYLTKDLLKDLAFTLH